MKEAPDRPGSSARDRLRRAPVLLVILLLAANLPVRRGFLGTVRAEADARNDNGPLRLAQGRWTS